MKNRMLLILTCLLITPSICLADAEPAYNKGELSNMHRKFRRGFLNVVGSPLEIPKQVTRNWEEKNGKSTEKILWVIPWTVSGIIHGARRIGGGLFELATFNKEKPGYFDPVIEPGYVFGPEETITEKISETQHPHIHFKGNLPSDAYLKD